MYLILEASWSSHLQLQPEAPLKMPSLFNLIFFIIVLCLFVARYDHQTDLGSKIRSVRLTGLTVNGFGHIQLVSPCHPSIDQILCKLSYEPHNCCAKSFISVGSFLLVKKKKKKKLMTKAQC